MTTFFIIKDSNKSENKTFETREELLEYLLEESEDILLGAEMEEILKKSKDGDSMSYEEFMEKYKHLYV